MSATFKAGQKVTTSGFPGIVVRMYSEGMVEVRLGSGLVCVPVGDVVSALRFEVGKTYSTRSIGDHNCIIRVTIAKRTAKTVTTTEGKTFRVSAYYRDGHEMIRPWGNHSMCPSITAEDTRELRPDWETVRGQIQLTPKQAHGVREFLETGKELVA
jgi:hypothetical protein